MRITWLVVALAISAPSVAQHRIVDRECGIETVIPSPAWAQFDQSAQGATVHLYSPDAGSLPRVTLMRFPAIFLPEGMKTRAARVAAQKGFDRVRLEATELGGKPATVFEYKLGETRSMEIGTVLGDDLAIVQVSAREVDWQNEKRAATYRAVFESLVFIDVVASEVVLAVDAKSPAEVRRLRELRKPPDQGFSITSHDIHLTIDPARGSLTVRDDFSIEATAETLTELTTLCQPSDTIRVSRGETSLEWRERGVQAIAIDLDQPLERGESTELRFECEFSDFTFKVDQKLVEEIRVLGQVREDSSYSSHVVYYPIDKRNDAAVKIALTVPAGYTAVSGGEPRGSETVDGQTTFRYEMALRSPRGLPLGFAVGRYEHIAGATPDGLQLDFYYPPKLEKEARQRLEVAMQSGAQFERMMGPLPWKRVAFCHVTPEEKAMGVSLPGLVLVSDLYYGDTEGVELTGANMNDPASAGLIIIADELSHQWNFYTVALPNELAEGISTFTNLLFIGERSGDREYRKGLDFCAQAYIAVAEATEDVALADPALYRSPGYRTVAFCKVPVVLDMLRQQLGDDVFFRAWRSAFAELRGRHCDYDDLERALGEAADTDLRPFFDQWCFQAGHPRLDVTWKSTETDGAVSLSVTVRQTQPGGIYRLAVPLGINGDGSGATRSLTIDKREETYQIPVEIPVTSIEVDPNRKLLLMRAAVRSTDTNRK